MSMTDPIADMLTRIRNAVAAGHRTVSMPSTKIRLAIAEVMKREGYIENFAIIPRPTQNEIKITLRYGPEGEKVIRCIERVSKPGRRIYRPLTRLPRVLNGLGIAVVSTNQGMLSDRECRRRRIGGEIICSIW